MPLETHLDADPASIASSATTVGDLKTSVDSAETSLINARKKIAGLESTSLTRARESLSRVVEDCSALVEDLGTYKTALTELSASCEAVRSDLVAIREDAMTAGLTVMGDLVFEPQDDGATVPCVVASEAAGRDKVEVWNDLVARATEVRSKETEARNAFANVCADLSPAAGSWLPSSVTSVFVPDLSGDTFSDSASIYKLAFSRGKNVLTLVEGAGLSKGNANLSHIARSGKNVTSRVRDFGRTVSSYNHPWQGGKLRNWTLPVSAEGTRAETAVLWARKAANSRLVKFGGRAANVATFALSAYNQWEKDSQDPSLGTREKVVRASFKGLSTAGGAAAGAYGGAKVGGAIGALVGGPLGAAIGGVAGGVVGGIAGTFLGDEVGDLANKASHAVDKAAGAVVDGAKDLAKGVGDAAKGLGKTVSGWFS